MYMPNMNFEQRISPTLRQTGYIVLILQFFGLVIEIAAIVLFNYPPKFYSKPSDFIIYLFIYGYTMGNFGIAGMVFESISILLGMVGIKKQSAKTLGVALSSLMIAAALHGTSYFLAMELYLVKMSDFKSKLLGVHVGLLVLQVVVGICLTLIILQIRRLSFNTFSQQSQGNQQAGYILPTVNFADSRFSPTIMDHRV